MKLVTPHLRRWRGTGSRSLFVLCRVSSTLDLRNLSQLFILHTIVNSPPRTQISSAPCEATNSAFRKSASSQSTINNQHKHLSSSPNEKSQNSSGAPTSLSHPHRYFHRRIICKPSSRADKRNRKRRWYPSLAKYKPDPATERRVSKNFKAAGVSAADKELWLSVIGRR
jgi:hypothetical protein